MINLLRSRSVRRAPRNVRFLATPSPKPFSQALEGGPSLDDFISGEVPERVVLGNTKAYVLFPFNSSSLLSVGQTSATCPLEDQDPNRRIV